ncbi:MAG: hypothetical protein R2795_09040 [Saprospiraceae bacterium]
MFPTPCFTKNIGVLNEGISPDITTELNVDAFIPTDLPAGRYLSPIMVPSEEWVLFNWQHSDTTFADIGHFTLFSGDEPLTLDSIGVIEAAYNGTLALNTGDWELGKYLQLRWSVSDSTDLTCPQLDYWHISKSDLAELAIDPAYHWQVSGDTLMQGDYYTIEVGISNIGQVSLNDSVALHFTWLNKGQIFQTDTFSIAPLVADESAIWKTRLPTAPTSLENQLLLNLNPESLPVELTRVNNTLNKFFFVGQTELTLLLT